MYIQNGFDLSQISELVKSQKGGGVTIVLIGIQLLILLLIPIYIMGTHYLMLMNTKDHLMGATEIASYKLISDLEIQSLSRDQEFDETDYSEVFRAYLYQNLSSQDQDRIQAISVMVDQNWLRVYFEYQVSKPWPKDLTCDQKYKIPVGY